VSSIRIEVDLKRLEGNARLLRQIYGARGINITAVTKAVCGAPPVAAALGRAGIHSFGDSRLANIQRMREDGIDAEFMLIRPPMPSEAARVVRLANVSLNTELSVVRLLAKCAREADTTHGVILMVEMGDLREGIMPSCLHGVVEQILGMDGVRLVGLGTNLACLNGVVPTESKMSAFSTIVEGVERAFGLSLEIVSGGNSACHGWATSAVDVGRVNHLRIGEAILLGKETVHGQPIPGLATDAFTVVGEVIEVKHKSSRPYGEIGVDAFGRRPTFSDRGLMRRAIVALGEQDIDRDALRPRIQADIVGVTSDQLVLHDRGGCLRVGGEVRFDVGYGTLLRAMTSPYVAKAYLPQDRGMCPVIRRPFQEGSRATMKAQVSTNGQVSASRQAE